MHPAIERVNRAINELKLGKMIILMDDLDRENEGDLIAPAETITPEQMNFMIRQGTGIVCLSLTTALIHKFNLTQMVSPHENSSARGTPFTVSIDAKANISTGVSTYDRVETIRV